MIIGVGLIILVIALALNDWKFMPEFEMKHYVAEGEITELRIDNSVGNIKTEFYDGEEITVDYPVSNRYSGLSRRKRRLAHGKRSEQKALVQFHFSADRSSRNTRKDSAE